MKQLAIVAGGLGTRLRERIGDIPKPMAPVGGRTLLEHQVALARRHGFSDILVFSCYGADLIEKHLGDGSSFGVRIRHVVEPIPLGTAGAVLSALDMLAEDFVVMYGDTMLNVDLDRFWQAHRLAGADATLLLHPGDHPQDSDLVEVDDGGWITAIHNRPHAPDQWRQNLVNAALYAIRKKSLAPWARKLEKMDFAEDLFPALLRRGTRLRGYNSPEYIKDIGTPQRYDSVCAAYAAGIIARSSFATPRPSVFLDRDGTMVKDISGHGVCSPDQLELLPDVAEAVRILNRQGLGVVVVTNQPVVAKGFCSEADLKLIHNKLETLLGRECAYVDRIYYCPHHPERGFEGERPEFKIECDCRKPATGMIRRALREIALDAGRSWLVGDSTADVLCAKQAGLRAVLVHTGHAGRDGKYVAHPDFEFAGLLEAARFISEQQT